MSIYAWRAWVVRYNGVFQGPYLNTEPRLHSVNLPGVWQPDVSQRAYCYNASSGSRCPPGVDCTCGIYATKTPGLPLGYVGPAEYLPRAVLGVVELWGRIVPHEYGYRAQFARPAALVDSSVFIASSDAPTGYEVVDCARLGAIYHIPVLPTVEALGKEFGLKSSMECHHPARYRVLRRMKLWLQPRAYCKRCGANI